MKYEKFNYLDYYNLSNFFTKEQKENIIKKYSLMSDFGIGIIDKKGLEIVKKIFFDLVPTGTKFQFVDDIEDLWLTSLTKDFEVLNGCTGYIRYVPPFNFECEAFGLSVLKLLRDCNKIDKLNEIKEKITKDKNLVIIPFCDYYATKQNINKFKKDYEETIIRQKRFLEEKSEIFKQISLPSKTQEKLVEELKKKYYAKDTEEF
jgi:hypothetical protein